MKKYLLSLMVFFTAGIVMAQDDASRIIDAQDTVVFDLSQASEIPGYVEFPVFFLSDDTVYSVDFNLQYNTADFAFDSIIKLASYLQGITFNEHIDTSSGDTTVLFSCYSLQQIVNDTPLVMVRFIVLTSGQFCSSDLNAVESLLNGDACTEKIVDCISTIGIADTDNSKNITGIFPNPATENVVIEFSLAAKNRLTVSVLDITGKAVFETKPAEYPAGSHKLNLNLSGLENGVYLVRINSENETKAARVSVIR